MNKKYSRYNTLLRVNDRFGLFYNAMSDRFIVLKTPAYDALRQNSVADLERNAPTLYGQLVEAGGIIDADIDEVQRVRDLIRRIDDDDTVFHLHVNPTVDCNFRCWYCYEDHVKGSKMSEKTRDAVVGLIDNIVSQHKGLRKFCLSFFGGEPLMYFRQVAEPLIEHLYEVCERSGIQPQVHFTTNGYLLTQRMVDAFEGKNVGFQITLDGGRELHDKTRFNSGGHGSFDKIVKNIKTLAGKGFRIVMRINYTADNIGSTDSIRDEFDDLPLEYKKNITVDFQRVWQDYGESGHEEDVEAAAFDSMEKFRKKGFCITNSKTHDSVRNSCYGSKRNYVLVNYNGDLFRCTARDFNAENRYGFLDEGGKLVYNQDLLAQRMTSRFSKPVCEDCRIAPVCGGGCAQKAMESRSFDECSLGRTASDVDKYVMDMFESRLMSSEIINQ